MHVRVDGYGGHMRAKQEDARRRFAADPRQARQQIHGPGAAHAAQIGEVNATVSISQCAQRGLNPVRLDNAQTAGADGVDQLVNVCVAHGLPVAEGPRQRVERPLGVQIRGVL